MVSKSERGDLGFDYQLQGNGEVKILLDGNMVATLRGGRANSFIKRLNTASDSEQQRLMASMAGSHKHGNERPSHKHIERDF